MVMMIFSKKMLLYYLIRFNAKTRTGQGSTNAGKIKNILLLEQFVILEFNICAAGS